MALSEGDDQLKISFYETLSARFSQVVFGSHVLDTGDLLESAQWRNPGQLRLVNSQRIIAKCRVGIVAHLREKFTWNADGRDTGLPPPCRDFRRTGCGKETLSPLELSLTADASRDVDGERSGSQSDKFGSQGGPCDPLRKSDARGNRAPQLH